MLCNYKLIAEMNFLLAPSSSTSPPLPLTAPPGVITPREAGPSGGFTFGPVRNLDSHSLITPLGNFSLPQEEMFVNK